MEPIFQDFVDSHDDAVAVSFNAWWPYSQDPFYQHNMADNTGRIEFYTIPSVPYERVDGVLRISGPHSEAQFQAAYDERKATPTSVSLEIEGTYDEDTRDLECTVTAVTEEELPAGDYRLHVVLTEDDIYFDGGNGIVWHQHVMRAMLPDHEGSMVSFSGELPQSVDASVSTVVDGLYAAENCHLVYFLQDHDTFEVHQSGSVALLDLGGTVAVGETPARFRIGRNYPNPFNPRTTIPVELERETDLRLEVVDAAGRLVRVLHEGALPAGSTRFTWDGRDDRQRPLASGVYLARIRSADGESSSRRMVMMK